MGRPQRQSPNANSNDRNQTQLHLEHSNPCDDDEDGGLTWMKRKSSHLLSNRYFFALHLSPMAPISGNTLP